MRIGKQWFFSSTIFRRALALSAVFIVLQLSIIVSVSSYSQYTLERQANLNTRYILNLCEETARHEMSIADKTLRYILTQDANLRLLTSSRENVSYHAAYEFNNIIDHASFADSHGKTYILADAAGRILVENRKDGFPYQRLDMLRPVLVEIVENKERTTSDWFTLKLDGEFYLTRYYICEGVTVMALLNLRSMWTGILPDDRTLMVQSDEDFFEVDSNGRLNIDKPNPAEQAVSLASAQLPLTLSMFNPSMIGQDTSPMPLLSMLSALLAVLFVVALVIYLYLEYDRPIAELKVVTRRIEEGDFQSRAALACKNRELQNLASSFNSMLDMILQLRIAQYENIIHRQDVELKYYYMQIRPHFYLNALSSMQSMCLRGETQRVSDYIMALSKNIRYMFNAGFQRVPLRAEMEHIDDYIRCQEILLPGCVFSYIDISEQAGGWMIPQMMVHTFVENVYKHVVSADNMVTLLVRADVVLDPSDGAEILRIIVEDDGKGFPESILAALNAGDMNAEGLEECVGLMNVRRTLSLMYGREDLMHIQNNGSAGSKIVLRIPRDSVSETRRTNL